MARAPSSRKVANYTPFFSSTRVVRECNARLPPPSPPIPYACVGRRAFALPRPFRDSDSSFSFPLLSFSSETLVAHATEMFFFKETSVPSVHRRRMAFSFSSPGESTFCYPFGRSLPPLFFFFREGAASFSFPNARPRA